jgi:hypothetical protein
MKYLIILLFIALFAFVLFGFNQPEDLIFSHKFHAEEVEASCTDCHETTFTSTHAADNLLPEMDVCYICHHQEETECKVCHVNPDDAAEVERIVDLKADFPHENHASSDEDCKTCHSGIEEKTNTLFLQFIPGREICANCHGEADFKEEQILCVECHNEDFQFRPIDHNLNWNKIHGVEAQINSSSCRHCHQNNYCTDCHEGDNLDHVVHPLNFRNSHGIHAKGNKDNCLTCHQEQAFCIECHQSELVMPRNHGFANWSNTRDGGRHAREALYDFDSCLSCHNDAYAENVCITCH